MLLPTFARPVGLVKIPSATCPSSCDDPFEKIPVTSPPEPTANDTSDPVGKPSPDTVVTWPVPLNCDRAVRSIVTACGVSAPLVSVSVTPTAGFVVRY